MQTLGRVQRGLEALYRVNTGVEVDDFVVGAELRDALVPARRPREQLLVSEADGEVALALFIDPDALVNLTSHDPARQLEPVTVVPAAGDVHHLVEEPEVEQGPQLRGHHVPLPGDGQRARIVSRRS